MTNHSNILASRTPWTVWKGKKIWHQKVSTPGWKFSNLLLGKSGEITRERMKRLGQSRNDTQLWMCLVVKVKSNAIKNNIAWASLVAQMVKHLPAMWETRVWFLGQEDPLKKEMATHSNTPAWKSPWMEEPGRLQSMRSQRVGHDWATSLSPFIYTYSWCTLMYSRN